MGKRSEPVPGSTPAGNLAYLVQAGVSPATLEKCQALVDMVLAELRVHEPVLSGDQIRLLQEVLDGVLDDQRTRALQRFVDHRGNLTKVGKGELFDVAAAGELLKLTNQEHFERILTERACQLGKTWEELRQEPHNTGPVKELQLRAAIWEGATSARTGGRHRNRYLAALEAAIHVYVADNRDELTSLIAGTPGSLSDTTASRSQSFFTSDSALHEVSETKFRAQMEPEDSRSSEDHLQQLRAYVHREDYERQFREVAKDTRRIGFVGEPGTGKTRLLDWARHEEINEGRSVVYIRAHDRGSLMTDMAGALAARKLHSRYFGWEELRLAFVNFMSSPDAPNVLAVDNIPSAGFLNELLPTSATPQIIYTSRETCLHSSTRNETREIIVGSMKHREAKELARSLLPDASPSDIETVCATLGDRPLAIEHACRGLLADGLMSVEQFCSAYRSRPAATMKRAESPVEETLTWIYEEILERLKGDDDVSPLQLLWIISFLSSEGIPVELVRSALTHLAQDEGDTATTLQFQTAVRRLRRMHLIEIANSQLGIHSLTQEIVHDLLEDKKSIAFALQSAAAPRLVCEIPARGLEPEVLTWISHIERFVKYLLVNAVDEEEIRRVGLDHTRAVLISGQRQLGDERYFLRHEQNLYTQEVFEEIGEVIWSSCLLETKFELLSLEYSAGVITPEIYLKSLFNPLVLVEVGGKLVRRPSTLVEIVYYIAPAIMACGHYSNAADLLRTLFNWPDLTEEIRADIKVLLGEIHVAHGKWVAAETDFLEAIRFYESTDNSLRALRGHVRALTAWHESILLGGKQEQLKEFFTHMARLDDNLVQLDELSKARMFNIKARQLMQTFLFSQGIALARRMPQTVRELDVLLQQSQELVGQAEIGYSHTGHRRELFGLSYEITFTYLFLRDNAPAIADLGLSEHLRQVRESGDIVNECKIRLAQIRMAVVTSNEKRDMIEECLHMAYLIADRFENAYWHCELLATACILSALFGLRSPKLVEAATSAYDDLGFDFKASSLRQVFDSVDQRINRARRLMVDLLPY